MPRTNIIIDQPLDGWSMTNRAEVTGDLRHYYAAPPPLRVLLVTRSGLTIADLRQGTTVLAQIGIDYGTPGFVLAEGRRHTKISVLAAVPDAALPTSTLSGVLARAPGARPRRYHGGGRPRLAADEPTGRLTASVPESYRRAVQAAGYGDISAGVRRIISEWLAAQKGGDLHG